jgi:predicted ABC-type ATPase
LSIGSLLVVTGPPGAGKSTVARRVADMFDPSVLVAGDAFFAFLARGAIPPWLPEADAQNAVTIEAAAAAAGRFARGGFATVYDGVVGPWFVPTFARACDTESFDYVILMPSVECCVERVQTRLDHGFSDEGATRKMHHEFASASIDARHLLVDPPDDIDEVAHLILARRATGALTVPVSLDPPHSVE